MRSTKRIRRGRYSASRRAKAVESPSRWASISSPPSCIAGEVIGYSTKRVTWPMCYNPRIHVTLLSVYLPRHMHVSDGLRIHSGLEPGPRAGGEFVLYWLQTAMRTAGNHALTFAIEQANRLRLPLLVYQGLRPDYPWASDRFHTFILESVVDLATDFRDRQI